MSNPTELHSSTDSSLESCTTTDRPAIVSVVLDYLATAKQWNALSYSPLKEFPDKYLIIGIDPELPQNRVAAQAASVAELLLDDSNVTLNYEYSYVIPASVHAAFDMNTFQEYFNQLGIPSFIFAFVDDFNGISFYKLSSGIRSYHSAPSLTKNHSAADSKTPSTLSTYTSNNSVATTNTNSSGAI
jgi:hypothetical protein